MMPIPDDLQEAYPDDWDEIRDRVLRRAADKKVVGFDVDFERHRMACSATEFGLIVADTPVCERCGKPQGWSVLSYDDHWEADFQSPREDESGRRPVKVISATNDGEVCPIQDLAKDSTDIVLTIAHMCHDPRCSEIDHLRALCQRCHLEYDSRPGNRARRKMIQREIRGQQTLSAPAGCPSVVGGR